MVAPPAYFGQGVELQMGDGTTPTEVFTTIPGVQSFDGPGRTRDTVDVTSHSSTGGYREFIAGLKDGGEISATYNVIFADVTQLALEDAFDSPDAVNWRVVYPMSPDEEYYEFAGLVTDTTPSNPIDAQVTKQLTIKITGPVTRVVPAP
jgi:predicted secreted protein